VKMLDSSHELLRSNLSEALARRYRSRYRNLLHIAPPQLVTSCFPVRVRLRAPFQSLSRPLRRNSKYLVSAIMPVPLMSEA
jgi:hypothetical protein